MKILLVCTLLFFIFLGRRKIYSVLRRHGAYSLFQIIAAIAIIYLINVFLRASSLSLPLNIFTISIIAFLHVPGLIAVIAINYFR